MVIAVCFQKRFHGGNLCERYSSADGLQFLCDVDVDAALQKMETLLFGDLGYLQQQLKQDAEGTVSQVPFLEKSLIRHGHAYYAGHISVDRMLDVLVDPYLRLAKAINQAEQFPEGPPLQIRAGHNIQEDFRAKFLRTWNNAVYWALQGIWHDTPNSYALIPGMTNKKRAKLRQGAIKANMIQVGRCLYMR